MLSNLNTRDLILRLKAIREEKGLTLQAISDLMDKSGHHVGITSIKRVFKDGSENLSFRYEDTIGPLADVLIGLYDDQGNAEAAALKAELAVKDEIISRYKAEVDRLTADLEKRGEDYDRGRGFLLEQIAHKDDLVKRMMNRVDEVLASNRDLLQQIQRLLEKM